MAFSLLQCSFIISLQRWDNFERYHIPQVIGLLPVLLYLALACFAIGLVDFLWHLNRGIAIYVTTLCGIIVIFHVFTTVVPFFTTRSPFKTPLSTFLGNLWRGMWQGKLRVTGLMDSEEMADIETMRLDLDRASIQWLKSHARTAEIRQAADMAQLIMNSVFRPSKDGKGRENQDSIV